MKTKIIITCAVILLTCGLAAQTAPDVYAFPAGTAGTAGTVKDTLDNVIDGTVTPLAALATLKSTPSSLRLVDATKGDIVWVYAFFRSNGTKAVDVTFKEVPRELVISRQFRTILQLASKIGGLQALELPIAVSVTEYELELERAELTINGKIVDVVGKATDRKADHPDWIVVLDFTGGGKATNAPSASATILTGTREAWAFSADVPIAGIGDVKVDDKAENIELADTPAAFYVGLNFIPAGDVLKPPASIREAFQVKALIKASRRPSDSFGLGVGLRSGYFSNHPKLKNYALLQIFDSLAPYVAYTRTRDQKNETDSAGATTLIRFKRDDIVFGLSLDITKALSFVKKEE